jgi:hypothetical protein
METNNTESTIAHLDAALSRPSVPPLAGDRELSLRRLLMIEERKLAITEYIAEKFGFDIPDDEELDRLFDELAGVKVEER